MGPPMDEKAVRRQTLLRNQQIAAALELGQSRKSMRLPYLDVTGKTQMGLTGPQRGHSKGKSTMFTGERGSYSYSTKCGPLRRASASMFDSTSGMHEVTKESRWKQKVSPAQADKFFKRLQTTTTVASRVLSGEQQAALTVECTKPSRFRQEGVSRERVEAIHEKLLADRNRRIEVTNQEYDHPTSTHCDYGGCSLAGREKLNTFVKLKFFEDAEHGKGCWGGYAPKYVPCERIEGGRRVCDAMRKVLVMKMHNINFHKRRALYLKHVPDMSKEHQRLYQILPEQEPRVGTVEEEIEFVERVIREREEAQVARDEAAKAARAQMAQALIESNKAQEARLTERRAAALQIVADIAKHDAFVEAQRLAREERSKEEVKATAARVKAYYERLAEVQKAADDAMKERVALWNEIGRQRDAHVAAAQATRDAELAAMRAAEKERMAKEAAVVYSETEFATTLRGFASEVDNIRKGHAERRKEEIKAAKQQSKEAAKEYWDKMSAKLEQMDAEIEERKQAVREYARKYEEGQRQRMEQRKAEAKALFEANIQRQQELAERIEKRFREHTSSFGK